MANPQEILDLTLDAVVRDVEVSYISDLVHRRRVAAVCRNLQNRACARALLACLLAKIHRPELDIRKPYTEIGGYDSYSGRKYDERYIADFVAAHELPCNRTTAFLTPALRNHDAMLQRDTNLVGRPPGIYKDMLALLDDVAQEVIDPQDLLCETVRMLVVLRNERRQRLSSLLANLHTSQHSMLSVDTIVNIVQTHLAQPHASRLPVLAILAIYKTIQVKLNEHVVSVHAHNAADSQTGSLGDIEVAVMDSDKVITVYEMKARKITRDDFEQAMQKLARNKDDVQQYLFIGTQPVSEEVEVAVRELNERLMGIEFAALDCISFVRYFLHLFYQTRMDFLNTYQELVLSEPESGVRHPMKELFLSLRQTAESAQC